jgi:hypothetical protein
MLYLKDLKCKVIHLVRKWLNIYSLIKVNIELFGIYLLPTSEKQEVKTFNTKYNIISTNTDLGVFFNEYQDIILKKASDFAESGSNWALAKILYLELNICKYGRGGKI